MDSEAPTPEEVKRATDACLRLLAVRARSRHELLTALERKGFSEPVREAALAQVAGWGYLDDERFARDRAAVLLQRGKYGPEAVQQRLQAHGLSREEASEAVAEATGAVEFDAEAAARQVLERRGLSGRKLGPKEHARAGRLLLSRGFSEDVIQRVLGDAALEPSGPDD
ncbi:regulatory protein [Archangium gephyra]|uniref:Regulatory protein RecX n=1 Tax=Archangium gephyra TaxID=48 RepID=A0AAC8TD95_9BACT|nr:regulatory protein RecX [Archangium gephyra]AKJ01725.1 Regulatory protein RecX [Archangium gephyra]REG34536.1 regulatory protein [Archangium gephyra]